MMDLSLRDLEYVATIARERNITRAAAALTMAQPALSQSLQRIERRLGVRLFDRTSRQVTPTAAGEVLADRAAEILDQVRSAVRDTRRAGGLPEVLRIHVSEPSLLTPRRILAAARAHVPAAAIHQTTLPARTSPPSCWTAPLPLPSPGGSADRACGAPGCARNGSALSSVPHTPLPHRTASRLQTSGPTHCSRSTRR